MTTTTVNVQVLKANITRLVRAAIEDSWSGSQPPENVPFIEFQLTEAKRVLFKQIGLGTIKEKP